MIRFLGVALAALVICGPLRSADRPADAKFEQQLTDLVAGPQVTVVHLWAPWCSNCRHEMQPDGWARFVAEHPAVRVVFVNIWHAGQDPAPKLAAAALGGQPNFTALTHPNASRTAGERIGGLLGLPVSWVPTTWVFRDGGLRYAVNYGEIRFPMLDQMVRDARAKW